MALKTIILERYASLSKANKHVADFFLESWETVAFSTLEELSQRIGVSTTTVIRFARELGYDGYSAIKQEIQNSLKSQETLVRRLELSMENVQGSDFFAEAFKCDVLNLNKTIEHLSAEDINRAVQLIGTAPTVYLMGLRGSFSVAHLAATRLGQVRENVRLLSGVGNIYPEELVSVHAGDVCLIYLFPRYSKVILNAMIWMKKHGVSIILITSPSHQSLDEYADVILPCWTQAISLKSSLVAPLCLTQYLIATVTMEYADASKQTLDKIEEIMQQDGYFTL